MQTNNGMTGVLGNSTPKKQDKVKDSRLAYFRENYVPDADDEDFDPTQYYYKRPVCITTTIMILKVRMVSNLYNFCISQHHQKIDYYRNHNE